MNSLYIFFVGKVQDHVPTSLWNTLVVPVRKDVLMVNGRSTDLFSFRLFSLLPIFQKEIEVSKVKTSAGRAQQTPLRWWMLLLFSHYSDMGTSVGFSRDGFCCFIKDSPNCKTLSGISKRF